MLFDRDYGYNPMDEKNNLYGCDHFAERQLMAPMAGAQPMMEACPPGGLCPPPSCCPPQVRCVQRCFVHEVPHTCPIHTQVINQHVCRHTYRPVYTCSQQDQVSHVYEGSCAQF
ncbi:MAG: hypothetical protein ACOXZW_03730 [Bacilli bacterium]|jgi:hypothetical protein